MGVFLELMRIRPSLLAVADIKCLTPAMGVLRASAPIPENAVETHISSLCDQLNTTVDEWAAHQDQLLVWFAGDQSEARVKSQESTSQIQFIWFKLVQTHSYKYWHG